MSTTSVDGEYKADRALNVEVGLELVSTSISADEEKPRLRGWRLTSLTIGYVGHFTCPVGMNS
jgi:hypothetical protein